MWGDEALSQEIPVRNRCELAVGPTYVHVVTYSDVLTGLSLHLDLRVTGRISKP